MGINPRSSSVPAGGIIQVDYQFPLGHSVALINWCNAAGQLANFTGVNLGATRPGQSGTVALTAPPLPGTYLVSEDFPYETTWPGWNPEGGVGLVSGPITVTAAGAATTPVSTSGSDSTVATSSGNAGSGSTNTTSSGNAGSGAGAGTGTTAAGTTAASGTLAGIPIWGWALGAALAAVVLLK